MIVVSTGCPNSIGPEVSLRAASAMREPCVLVGDANTLRETAESIGIPAARLRPASDLESAQHTPRRGLFLDAPAPPLSSRDRRPGKPNARGGLAQLLYVERAFHLARKFGVPLVTAAVSKEAIARSGEARAASFRGHTEWLQQLDGARAVTMCFWTKRFSTALVTTHLPLRRVPAALGKANVEQTIVHLVELLHCTGCVQPRLAICSLNPHAGEGELLGDEERVAIAPGINAARRRLRGQAQLTGPTGAETAYRLAQAGHYDGVVAMYHDQATIPTKLVAFGDAVNVTMGLSIRRTSVDHGTAYDIAGTARADASGMRSALRLASRLVSG